MQIFLMFKQNVTISGQYNTAADMSLADYFCQCPILFTDLIGI